MVRLIVGSRGSGKTKKLIEQVKAAAAVSKGHVICIEKGHSLRFDLNYHIRLINMEEYKAWGPDAYYGFIAGLLAGNYDITEVFGDATFKILCGKDEKNYEALADFVERLSELVKDHDTSITLTVSCDPADLPERIASYIQE